MIFTDTSRPRAGYIYALYDKTADKYKLGKAIHVQKRVKQLQTGNSTDIEIKYTRYVSDYYKAESAMHQIFSAYRRNREWFSLDRQSKVLLEKIFTLHNLTALEKETLQRFSLL